MQRTYVLLVLVAFVAAVNALSGLDKVVEVYLEEARMQCDGSAWSSPKMKRGACAVLEEVTETILEQIPLYVQTRTGLEDEKIINNLLSPASRLGGNEMISHVISHLQTLPSPKAIDFDKAKEKMFGSFLGWVIRATSGDTDAAKPSEVDPDKVDDLIDEEAAKAV